MISRILWKLPPKGHQDARIRGTRQGGSIPRVCPAPVNCHTNGSQVPGIGRAGYRPPNSDGGASARPSQSARALLRALAAARASSRSRPRSLPNWDRSADQGCANERSHVGPGLPPLQSTTRTCDVPGANSKAESGTRLRSAKTLPSRLRSAFLPGPAEAWAAIPRGSQSSSPSAPQTTADLGSTSNQTTSMRSKDWSASARTRCASDLPSMARLRPAISPEPTWSPPTENSRLTSVSFVRQTIISEPIPRPSRIARSASSASSQTTAASSCRNARPRSPRGEASSLPSEPPRNHTSDSERPAPLGPQPKPSTVIASTDLRQCRVADLVPLRIDRPPNCNGTPRIIRHSVWWDGVNRRQQVSVED